MERLTYAESYTGLIRYVSDKYDISFEDVLIRFSKSGIEDKFTSIYDIKTPRTIYQYYKLLKEDIRNAIS